MKPTVDQATRIGAKVKACLALKGTAWTVLASVRGAIYIHRDPNELLWITDRKSTMHGRAIEIGKLPSSMPPAGSSCRIDQGILSIGHSMLVELKNASVWEPRWPAISTRQSRDASPDLGMVLAQVARTSPPQGGFARLLPALRTTGTVNRLEAEMAAVAREAIGLCQQVPSAKGLLDVLDRCRGLIGLGAGLTPSGDDFLAAYLFTLRANEIVNKVNLCIDWQQVRAWLQRESIRTNAISSTLMLDCASGFAAAPLHEFVTSTLRNDEIDEVVFRACQLSRIGHSSGWDMLVGVHAAFSSLECMSRDTAETERVNRHAVCRKEVAHVR